MKVAFLLLVFLVGAFGQDAFSFKANVSLTNGDQFTFRASNTVQFNVLTFYSGLYLSSLSVDVNPNSATFDGLYGAAYAGLTSLPSAYLTFVYSSSQWVINPNDYTQANTSAAAGFIGKTFISLDEVDGQGNVQNTISLKGLLWSTVDKSVGQGGLRYLTIQATQAGMTVKISFIYSDVVGVLNVIGTAVVTPKTFESIISIQNFPYKSTANSVRLNLGVGTAAAAASVQGAVTHLVSGSGQTGTFLTLDHVASINGAATPVSISAFTNGNGQLDFGNDILKAQVVAKYGAAASFQFVSVTFPAGATNIVYDPSIGAGASPPTSSGMKNVASFFALMIAFAAFLL
jgi:hypothetical protein